MAYVKVAASYILFRTIFCLKIVFEKKEKFFSQSRFASTIRKQDKFSRPILKV